MSVDQFREMIRERYGDLSSVEYEAVRWNAGGFVALGMLFDDAFYCAPRKFKGLTRQAWRLAVLAPRPWIRHGDILFSRKRWGGC